MSDSRSSDPAGIPPQRTHLRRRSPLELTLAAALAKAGTWTFEFVMGNALHNFVVPSKRWTAEHILALIGCRRRLVKHFERYVRKADAFIRLAMIPRPTAASS